MFEASFYVVALFTDSSEVVRVPKQHFISSVVNFVVSYGGGVSATLLTDRVSP